MSKETTSGPSKEIPLPHRLLPPGDVELSPAHDTTIDHLVQDLPRELRDLIYFHLILDTLDVPFHLNEQRLKSPFTSPGLSGELLEAVFTHRPCHVTFTNPDLLETGSVTSALLGSNLPHRSSIRHLVVRAHESPGWGSDFEDGEHYCTVTRPSIRQKWNEVLMLPRLESFTIELQKGQPEHFFTWFDFAPIVYELRARSPRIEIMFCISFDELIETEWNFQAAMIADFNGEELMHGDPYLPMGFADVSCLIGPPTAEDYEYVKEHLPGETEARGREIVRGLLDETPNSRRQLAEHYVVKEPPLLRVLMAEYYQKYKKMNGRGD